MNESCDKKLKEQKQDLDDRCDKDIRDTQRTERTTSGTKQIKLMNSWNIKCKKEKDGIVADETERCLKKTSLLEKQLDD
jgi:hypothetical protein